MSILIKGVDLPEAYTSAWLTVLECVGEHTFMKTYKVSAEQIQAIPPHGRLIDAEKLERDIEQYHLSDGKFQHWVQAQNSIIEAEEGEPHEQN